MSHSDSPFDHEDEGDVAPGVVDATGYRLREGLLGYVLGLIFAALLTVASFYVSNTGVIWAPGIPVALVVFAVAQIGVHLVFFLHITTDPDNTNNILALAFGILIVALVFGGSLWIMGHLNDRMMPMGEVMMMQR